MKKAKRSLIIWRKIAFNNNFNSLIKKYRDLLRISEADLAKFKNDKKSFYVKLKTNKQLQTVFLNFGVELKNIINDPYIYDQFLPHLEDYLISGAETQFAGINLTGCDLVLICEEKDCLDKNKFTPGLYIKIKPQSSFKDLQEFANNNRKEIAMWQNFFQKDFQIKIKRIRDNKNWIRDYYIYRLSLLSKDELRKKAKRDINVNTDKSILIETIIERMGFKFGVVNSDNIRKIISTQKKLHEKISL